MVAARPFALAAAVVCAGLAFGAPARAADTAKDPVVATVDGEEIRRSEVDATIRMYGAELSKLSPGEQASVALDRLIDATLVAEEARDRKLDKNPEVARQLAEVQRRILQQALLGRIIDEVTTEKALKERYATDYGKGKGLKQVRARHVLTYTRGEAESVIEALEKGGDFGKLAAEHSVDNSGKQGGDLGWFARSDMVPAFGKAAFELKVGEYTEKPVESQFGWHVIKVEDTRTQPAPPFEKARDDIERQLAEEAVVGLLTELRAKAKIEKKH